MVVSNLDPNKNKYHQKSKMLFSNVRLSLMKNLNIGKYFRNKVKYFQILFSLAAAAAARPQEDLPTLPVSGGF